MKTIFTLLLLPLLLFAQPQGFSQNRLLQSEFIMDIDMEYVWMGQLHPSEKMDGTVELSITIEIYYGENTSNHMPTELLHRQMPYRMPKHLTTLAFLTLYQVENTSDAPQKRLDQKLAMNDTLFPKENTFYSWLNTVGKQNAALEGLIGIPGGFGPRIIL